MILGYIAAHLILSGVEDLEIGDIVWTVDALGRRVVVAFLKIGHVSAPAAHEMIRLLLEDGCQIDFSDAD